MSKPDAERERLRGPLDKAAAVVAEDPDALDNPELVRAAMGEVLDRFRGDPVGALRYAVREAIRARSQRDQLVDMVETFKRQLGEQPRLSRVLSRPFPFGNNGDVRRLFYAAPAGRESVAECVCVADPHQTPPPPLSFCYTDSGGKFYLGAAPQLPLAQLEEHPVVRADRESDFADVGCVVVNDGPEHHSVLLADRKLVETIQAHLEGGEGVVVRHDRLVARGIVESSVQAPEDWLEIPPLDGPVLSDLVFPRWLREEWQRDVRWMVSRRPLRVLLVGPTGTGKTEGVLRAGRQAAREADRQLAILRMSAPYIGSSYYSETERTIHRAVKRAERLARQGYVTMILIDEADALLGNSEHRYEGAVDRRVRLAFQELLSGELEGVAVYLTMNPRSDSWLPAAIDRRFRKRRYPRTRRRQMAGVCAGSVEPAALDKLGVTASEFGGRVADFVYAGGFVVARVLMHSGATTLVRARDLHDCSPGKLQDLIRDFCHDVEDGATGSLEPLWTRLDREFRSASLNEANLFEMTFLARPDHDTVKKVEPVLGGGSTAAPVLIA
ncbi:MAG TPA: AAA family ATPase [Thermoguttaceae bacterium]|nr:AAA family ATPase [Thermoguttaceae bacterium]